MAELFRFSVVRPADRFKTPTVALERPPPGPITLAGGPVTSPDPTKSFQDQLRDTVQAGVDKSLDTKSIWESLEPLAFDFIAKQAQSILTSPLWGKLSDFLSLIRKTVDQEPSKIGGDDIAKQFSDLKAQPGFSDYHYNLSDLFLALVIVRRGGPVHLDANIRNRKLWASTDLLSNNPSLSDLADLIRFAQVVKDGPAALIPPSTGSGNAPAWKVGMAYKAGDLINFKNRTYRCLQAHTSQNISPPDVSPSLWHWVTIEEIRVAIQAAFNAAMNKTLLFPPALFSPLQKPVHNVGFRELHVVKQHIRRYEMKEVAQIENILQGETRAHTQKHTLSNERDITVEVQTTTETDKELTTTDHVDIKNETQSQVKQDTKIDGGVHAQYDGPSYKLQTDLTASYDRSSDDSKKFSSDVAKDITQKAVTKVTQQVTQIQTTKVIETFEDTQAQSFDNKTGPGNISGVYQWVEKVYLSQVFNLGRHMLLELMVPEPGAALLAASKGNKKAPIPPDPLGSILLDPMTHKPVLDTEGHKQLDQPLKPSQLSDDITSPQYFDYWVSKFQVTGVEPPPPMYTTASKSYAGKKTDDNGHVIADPDIIQIPTGYRAKTVTASAVFLHLVPTTGGAPANMDVTVGELSFHFDEDPSRWQGHYYNNYVASASHDYPDTLDAKSTSTGDLAVTVTANWVEYLGVDVVVICKREEIYTKWQLTTYDKIAAAWQKLQEDYQAKLAEYNLENQNVGPLGGDNPDANRLIERTELKRQCIAIMDNNNATVRGSTAAVQDSPDAPVLPEPDLTKAQELGAIVLWFEQAFEWENIAYVSYPYFWGRRATWQDRLALVNNDPLFVAFMQSGYARVVVPVRLGFEPAVQVYLNTGLPWLGGGVPPVGDATQNPLYLDVAEEIKALTGGDEAGETEIPVGDPWEYTLPTTLLKLRSDDELPEWHRVGANGDEDEGNYPSNAPDGPWSWKDGAPK